MLLFSLTSTTEKKKIWIKILRDEENIFVHQILPVLKYQAEFIIKYFVVHFTFGTTFFIRFVSRYVHFQIVFWQKQYFVEGNGIEKARKYSFTSERTQSFLRKDVDGKLHYKTFRLNFIKNTFDKILFRKL